MHFVLIILTVLFCLISMLTRNKRISNISFTIIWILICVIVFFRDVSIGIDTREYVKFYNLIINEIDMQTRFEIGFASLTRLLSLLESERIYLIVIAAIPITFISKSIKTHSKFTLYSTLIFILLGFYTNLFNWSRQIIAMALVLWSLKDVLERNGIVFMVKVIIASMFHVTAVIFIPFYFFSNIKLSKLTYIMYYVSILVMFVFGDNIIPIVLSVLGNYDYSFSVKGGFNLFLILFAFNILIIIVSLFYKTTSSGKYSRIYIHASFFALIFQSLTYHFSLFTRLTSYYTFIMILSIPYFSSLITDKKIKIAFNLFLILIMIALFYTNYKKDLSEIYPYLFMR